MTSKPEECYFNPQAIKDGAKVCADIFGGVWQEIYDSIQIENLDDNSPTWEPQPDITTFELARSLKPLIDILAKDNAESLKEDIEKMSEKVNRHWGTQK